MYNSSSRPSQPNALVVCLTSASAIAGLVALSTAPALAIYGFDSSEVSVGDYQRCASTLTGLKLTPEESLSACAKALKPQDLSTCVSQTAQAGSIAAADALNACRQVRRPVDMSTCVTDLRRDLSAAPAAEVLNSCRRSLLPQRFASCVRGINQAAKLEPAQALFTCIDASDFPRELDPTFLPFSPSSEGTTQPSYPLTPSTPTPPSTTTPTSTPPAGSTTP